MHAAASRLRGLRICQPCDFSLGDSNGHKQGGALQCSLQMGEPRKSNRRGADKKTGRQKLEADRVELTASQRIVS